MENSTTTLGNLDVSDVAEVIVFTPPLTPIETPIQKNDRVPIRKNHFFTWNNYTEQHVDVLLEFFNEFAEKYAFQEELAPSSKTPHLQGMVCFKKQRRSTEWDPESKGWYAALKDKSGKYQLKDETRPEGGRQWVKGIKIPVKIEIISVLYPWQKKIENLILEKPDNRKIYWFWESKGNIGKSAFVKYCIVKHKILFCDGGKKSDLVNLVFNQDMNETKCVIWDLPRSSKGSISYSTLECVKNGMVCNTKYETGVKVFNSPHIIVFANYPPEDMDKLSEDRWVVTEL